MNYSTSAGRRSSAGSGASELLAKAKAPLILIRREALQQQSEAAFLLTHWINEPMNQWD